MNWLLDLLGYHREPSMYTRQDMMGLNPNGNQRPVNRMGLEGMSPKELADIERRKSLPENVQLKLLEMGR